MVNSLSIDVETFSLEDIKKGVHKYTTQSELLLFAYSLNREPIVVVDIAQGELIPQNITDALFDKNVVKKAWNAAFEIEQLERYFGVDMKISQWQCTMVKAARCGYPLSLDAAAKAIGLPVQKDSAGKALIKLFSVPRKPTKNNPAIRVYPSDNPEKWDEYKRYNKQDVVVEMHIDDFLSQYPDTTEFEKKMYVLDRQINRRGIALDIPFIQKAIQLDDEYKQILTKEAKDLTGLDNPNSVAQLKDWFGERQLNVDSLNKETLKELLVQAEQGYTLEPATRPVQDGNGFGTGIHELVGHDKVPIKESDKVLRMLQLRKELSNTSVKKYIAMIGSEIFGRIYDTIQFNGAGRTGRNAGRLIQPQNLPRVLMSDEELDIARRIVKENDLDTLLMCFESASSVLSQLIRTALVSSEGKILYVVDLSAIEARVLAWLAGEEHVLEVFRTHGKIYEATASSMFKVPFESVTKGSEMRQRGKTASLACLLEDTEVLTREGWVRITSVSENAELWDGENWVPHGGVVYKGYKITINVNGVRMTRDHQVLTKYGWYPASDVDGYFLEIFEHFYRKANVSYAPLIGPVYDILNVGPNNRFTVRGNDGGLIVHNCGYQGGVNAITTMDLDKKIPDEDKPGLVKAWRAAHPNIVRYWYKTQESAIKAIENPGEKVYLSKGAYFVTHKDALLFYLPSGRYLMYPKVGLEEGQYGKKITFWGLDQTTNQWKKQDTYGGKLVENETQAVARDILMEGMYNMVRKGYDLVTNVHDETVSEVELGFGSIEEVEKLMCDMPAWADGLPLGAEGFKSEYYKK